MLNALTVRGFRRATVTLAAVLLLSACASGPSARKEAAPLVSGASGGPVFVAGKAGRLFVDDGGSGGVPVVFVHGLAGDHGVWTGALAHLRTGRRAVALDLRGHGASDPSARGDYGMESFADDVASVADALGLERFVLVGHSMGGAVVAAYAQHHPERVAGLFFVDSVGDLSGAPRSGLEAWLEGLEPESYAESTTRWFGGLLLQAKPEVRDQVLAALRRTDPAVVRGAANSLTRFPTAAALAGFEGPMEALVTTENSGPVSLQNLVPGLEARVVEGASHWIMLDEPAAFDGWLDAFLGRVDEAEGRG